MELSFAPMIVEGVSVYRLIKLIALLFFTGVLSAVNLFEDAGLLSKGERSNGILDPKRYGMGRSYELSSRTLIFPVAPNVSVKWSPDLPEHTVAGKISLIYPTPLFRLVQRSGTGGLITPDPDAGDFPEILGIRAEVLGSRFFPWGTVTLTLAGMRELTSRQIDDRLIIDHPLVYSWMKSFQSRFSYSAGFSVEHPVNQRWRGGLKVSLLRIPDGTTHTRYTVLAGRQFKKYLISAGMILIYGEYPYGSQWFLAPLLNVQWSGKK